MAAMLGLATGLQVGIQIHIPHLRVWRGLRVHHPGLNPRLQNFWRFCFGVSRVTRKVGFQECGRREFQWWVMFQSMGSGSYCKKRKACFRLGSWLCIRLWVVVHGPPGLRGHVRDRDGRWNWDRVCRVLLQHATQARKSFRHFGGF